MSRRARLYVALAVVFVVVASGPAVRRLQAFFGLESGQLDRGRPDGVRRQQPHGDARHDDAHPRRGVELIPGTGRSHRRFRGGRCAAPWARARRSTSAPSAGRTRGRWRSRIARSCRRRTWPRRRAFLMPCRRPAACTRTSPISIRMLPLRSRRRTPCARPNSTSSLPKPTTESCWPRRRRWRSPSTSGARRRGRRRIAAAWWFCPGIPHLDRGGARGVAPAAGGLGRGVEHAGLSGAGRGRRGAGGVRVARAAPLAPARGGAGAGQHRRAAAQARCGGRRPRAPGVRAGI